MKRRKKLPATDPVVSVATEKPTAMPAIDWWRRFWPYLMLAALAFGIYAGALANGFVSDDRSQLLNNPSVTDIRHIGAVFSQDVWAFRNENHQTRSNFYRPIQILVYIALYQLLGFNAVCFHMLMVLIHVANTLLVFHLAGHFFRDTDQPRPAALAAGALFAVHPIHVEAVAWVAVLPDVLITLLALIMLTLFARQQGRPTTVQSLVHALLFLLALLTKETSAVILPMFVAYEWLYLNRTPRQILGYVKIYGALIAAFISYLAARVHALGQLAPAQEKLVSVHGLPMFLSMIVLMGRYAWKLVAPLNLNSFYVFEPTPSINLAVVASLTLIVAVVAAIHLLRRRIPSASFSLVFIVLPLLPVMNINGVNQNVFTERYLYLPSVGFVWLVALLWNDLRQRIQGVAWSLLAVVVIAASWEVIARVPDWHDDMRLLTVTARQSPQDAGLHLNLAAVFMANGRPADAIVELQRGLAIRPNEVGAYFDLGVLLDGQGRTAEAIAAEQEAVRRKPGFAEALNQLGVLHMKTKDYPAAMGFLNRAIAVAPGSATAYMNLGLVYMNMDDYQQAITPLRQGIELGPDDPNLFLGHYSLGLALSHLNSKDEAVKEFQKACALRPDFTPARQALEKINGTER